MCFSMHPEVEQKDSEQDHSLPPPFAASCAWVANSFVLWAITPCVSFYRNKQIPQFLFSYDFIFGLFTRYILKYDYIYSSLSNSPHSPPMCPSQFHVSFCLITYWVKLMLLTCARVWGQLPEHGKPPRGNTLMEEWLPLPSHHQLLLAPQWGRCQIYLYFSSFLY